MTTQYPNQINHWLLVKSNQMDPIKFQDTNAKTNSFSLFDLWRAFSTHFLTSLLGNNPLLLQYSFDNLFQSG